jgi:hypothetical protein
MNLKYKRLYANAWAGMLEGLLDLAFIGGEMI